MCCSTQIPWTGLGSAGNVPTGYRLTGRGRSGRSAAVARPAPLSSRNPPAGALFRGSGSQAAITKRAVGIRRPGNSARKPGQRLAIPGKQRAPAEPRSGRREIEQRSVRVAPFYIAGSAFTGRRLAVVVALLRGCIGGVLPLIVGSIPVMTAPTGARVMLGRCRHLNRRSSDQPRAENNESCFLHLCLRWWTLPRDSNASHCACCRIMSENALASDA